jgi:hypothetical protein
LPAGSARPDGRAHAAKAKLTRLNDRFGSVSECRLLAKNPLKLPGKFQDRDDCPRMAGRGWN